MSGCFGGSRVTRNYSYTELHKRSSKTKDVPKNKNLVWTVKNIKKILMIMVHPKI